MRLAPDGVLLSLGVPEGNPTYYRNVRFTEAVREVKLEDFTGHDLRHTFASRLVMAGVDIRTVHELMGHKSITITMRTRI